MLQRVFLLLFLALFVMPAYAAGKDSVFDRVMKTGVLHCGYWNWEPLYIIDANTKETSGIFKDVMTEFARVSGLKVEWIAEVHFENLVTDLNSGKLDAVCAGAWSSALRAKFIRFSRPVFYIAMNAYKRAGDARFDGRPQDINKPGVTAVVMDGEMSSEIRNSDFPDSKILSIPQMAGSGTELLMNVATGKADVTFTDAVNGAQFMKANPGKIQPVKMDMPLRLMPNTIAVAGDEERLQDFINTGLLELQNSGVFEKILKKYDAAYPGVLVRVAQPYASAP